MTILSITSLVSVMVIFLQYHDDMMVTAFSNKNNALFTTTTIPHHSSRISTNTNLHMVDNKAVVVVELPRDVKEAVSKCRQATQDALAKRLSRMDIEFPIGTDFGVEKKKKPTKGGGRGKRRQDADVDDDNDETNIQTTLDRSDRELARLFVEMFQPVGGDNIAVSFVDDSLADVAKTKWKNDAGATCRVLAMNRRPGGSAKKKKKRKKVLTSARGFAAKLEAEIGSSDDDENENENDNSNKGGSFQLPSSTEVALFVAPGPKELIVIEKICETMGMGTLVILLNARLDKVTNYGTEGTEKLFTEEFESVFSLAAAPQEEAPNCLLFRAYPGEWVLARKPNVGRPKTILSQTEKPTTVECRQAFDELEITDLEKNVEGFVDNVAGWFR
jgi:hypothetical protein